MGGGDAAIAVEIDWYCTADCYAAYIDRHRQGRAENVICSLASPTVGANVRFGANLQVLSKDCFMLISKFANVRNGAFRRGERAASYLDRIGRVARPSRESLGACRLSGFFQ